MAGWDGNGNFVMPYSMVQQAGAGVKILSTVQDTQWNAVAAGLMNCMTLDSQTKPKADVDIATHKLINVSAPAAATDAANKSYVDTAVAGINFTEWLAESHGVAWVSTTSFSVAGVNVTAIYHAGRRVKITHNTGGTVSYGTVVSSAFGVNTTVVVAMDGGTALVSTVTAVSYGLVSYVNPSYLDPRTAIFANFSSGPQNYPGTGYAKVSFNNTLFDNLGEFSTAQSRFTPTHPGVYALTLSVTFTPTANGLLGGALVLYRKGGFDATIQQIFRFDNAVGGGNYGITASGIVVAAVNDYFECFFSSSAGSFAVSNGSYFSIARIA